MMEAYITFGIVIGFLIDFIVSYFVLKKYQDTVTMEAEVKERVLQLFLYAEKLNLIGSDKMAYVASKIEDHIAGKTIELVLNEKSLTVFLQEQYDEVFKRIKN